jgi:hypothetical protein
LSFAEDLALIRRCAQTVELTSGAATVVVVPEWQGRVMTSAAGPDLPGNGYVHRPRIESGRPTPHINVFGGEERFWLGPEGGPFSVFFRPGEPQVFERWQTPALIDSVAFRVESSSAEEVVMVAEGSLENAAGFRFQVGVRRRVRLLPSGPGEVAYRTESTVTNLGAQAWRRETGLLSVWLLGMLPPDPRATVVVPLAPGEGSAVNSGYFGEVPPDRLVVGPEAALFRGDGAMRGKIGVSARRARPVLGSFVPLADGQARLTVVRFEGLDPDAAYVDSVWGEQADPYGGDAVNSYNDGPPEPGAAPLGPFYELETSSPGLALGPGGSAPHAQETRHTVGSVLGRLEESLGVSREFVLSAPWLR